VRETASHSYRLPGRCYNALKDNLSLNAAKILFRVIPCSPAAISNRLLASPAL
jgi:hypothetical protein